MGADRWGICPKCQKKLLSSDDEVIRRMGINRMSRNKDRDREEAKDQTRGI